MSDLGVLGYFAGFIFGSVILATMLIFVLNKVQHVNAAQNRIFLAAVLMAFVAICINYLTKSLMVISGDHLKSIVLLLSVIATFLAQSLVISKLIKISYKKSCVTVFAVLVIWLILGFIVYYATNI